MTVKISGKPKGPTVATIDANASLVRDLIAQLEDQARELAFPVVSGDERAIASLASVQQQLRQGNADLAVWREARTTAVEMEVEATRLNTAEYRALHMSAARDQATKILTAAGRADHLLAELKLVLSDMTAIERQIWNSLREASAPPEGAIVGRKNLAQFAIDRLLAFANGSERIHSDRPATAEIARRAWGSLLTVEVASDDI